LGKYTESKSQKKGNNIEGVIVPVITPVNEDECLDEEAFRMVIRRCLEAGVDGIFVGGSAGMGPLLLDSQWVRSMEVAKDEVNNRSVLMGGVIAVSTACAIEKIRILDRIGYECVVITPTFYIALTLEEEILSHFGSCRDATDMDMVIYNIPSCTHCSIPLKMIEEMLHRGWVSLCKESSGDQSYFSKLLHICKDYGVGVLQGYEPDIEWALSNGAAGIVPVCANYEPTTYVSAFLAAQRGDRELLRKAQERIADIRNVLLMGSGNWISGIMYGMSTLGIGTGIPLRPLQPVRGEHKLAIDRLGVQVDDISVKEV